MRLINRLRPSTITLSAACGFLLGASPLHLPLPLSPAAAQAQPCQLTITCPANITKSNDPHQCGAVATYVATASSECPPVTLACTPPSGSTYPVGTTTVTCTATDAAGNTASCSFTVTVRDLEPPFITCPANITVPNAPGQCGAVVTYGAPTATDNCSLDLLTCTPASGSVFPVGTTVVSCTARDPSSNTATCASRITVNDTEAPVIGSMPDITHVQGLGPVGYPLPPASDNCPDPTVSCVPPSGSVFQAGTTPVNCTATDDAGNTSQTSFLVTLLTAVPTLSHAGLVAAVLLLLFVAWSARHRMRRET